MKPIFISLDDATGEKLDALAQSLGRSRSWVVRDAIEQYLENETRIIEAIKAGIADADAGNLIPHEELMAELHARNDAARRASTPS
ncbi:CopG family ribbon-helix-helix protein [Maricaulis salignorans]|uniref:CopG family ribbon-helix-helix protein n=1 Tax=Maricaulis salignorans TaxID=144026 RepID=UPI003A911899